MVVEVSFVGALAIVRKPADDCWCGGECEDYVVANIHDTPLIVIVEHKDAFDSPVSGTLDKSQSLTIRNWPDRDLKIMVIDPTPVELEIPLSVRFAAAVMGMALTYPMEARVITIPATR